MTAHALLPAPERDQITLPDGAMALLRWRKEGAPRLVFAHANGFCASAYRPILSRLAGRFDIVAADLRGHGRTRLPADPRRHKSWDIYARDITALCERLDRPPDLLAGHSMGATSCLLAAPRMIHAPPLVLVEPVILPALVYAAYRTPLSGLLSKGVGMGDLARKRSNGWPDAAAVAERYRNRPAFRDWASGGVEAYLEDGLVQVSDGVRLACDPHWEAANFEAQGHDPLTPARRFASQLRVLKAARGSTVRNTAGLTRRGVAVDEIANAGHLAPMSAPDRIADWISVAASRFSV